MSPQRLVEILDRQCLYNHNAGNEFTTFPSANVDFHFLRSSLASYHTAALKSLFETDYRLIRSLFHFNLTAKPSLFLFPCEAPSVIWDRRFGTAFDPTRNTGYVLYASRVNTADPFVLIHGAILRSFGYAPPFLTEGLANYLSLALHTIQKIKNSGGLVSLSELVQTRSYLTSDPTVADATAATFVRYLIDRYSAGVFMALYDASDDLNLATKIEAAYAKPLAELEKEWLNYVDTMKIPGEIYSQFADRAEQMLNYPLALEYRRAAFELARIEVDSLLRLEQLADDYFLNGDYFNAAGKQELLARIDAKNPQRLIGLAGYQMMNGDYVKAKLQLDAAQANDSTGEVLKFNLALNRLLQGDTIGAAQLWKDLVHNSATGQLSGEARTMLAHILRRSKIETEKQQAQDYFTVALAIFNQPIQTNPALPNPYMWSGIALAGLGDGGNAYDQLNQALFLESRPFYIGMINLWLGKAADLRQKRKLAEEHYAKVMTVAAATYHQEEARMLLENSYTQPK